MDGCARSAEHSGTQGHRRWLSAQVWCNAAGEELIESYTILRMAHGTPLAVGEANDQCGAAGAFLLDVSISSSYHIAKFWGLADYPCAALLQADTPAPNLIRPSTRLGNRGEN